MKNPHLVVLRFRRNTGQTAAIQAGFDHCTGEVVVTMDGDLQNDPNEIPRLLELIDQGYDVASGWRRDRQDKAVSRRLPSMVANWLIGAVTGVHIHDNGCTLKAYRSEVVKAAKLYAEMHRFLVPMLSLSGCRITEVVVNHRRRQHGVSKYGLSRIWKVLLDLVTIKMLLRFSSHPAAWFALLAFPFLVLALPAAALSAYLYLAAERSDSFAIILPSIMTLSAFTAGNLLALGMFAELVVRTGDFKQTEPVKSEVLGEER
jgi:glycosyltransferase involved in cell wall biosynthesis